MMKIVKESIKKNIEVIKAVSQIGGLSEQIIEKAKEGK